MPTAKKAPAKKAAAKAAAPKSEPKEEAVSGDAGAADLQSLADRDTSQGFFGISNNDQNPNEAYSLKSGPDSPSAAAHTPAAKAKKES